MSNNGRGGFSGGGMNMEDIFSQFGDVFGEIFSEVFLAVEEEVAGNPEPRASGAATFVSKLKLTYEEIAKG